MRAAIFIDGAHLLKQIGDARVTPDYAKLADYFLAPLRRNLPIDLLRCYFYYCPPWMSSSPTDEELRRKANWDRFIAELEDLDRWQVRLGKLERRREGDKEVFSQKRVDVLLSVDMVRHAAAGHIQHVVLVAGDSDFIPAVEAVKDSGTTLTLWAATDRSAHLDLIQAADEVQYLRWKSFPQKTKEAGRNAPPAPELGRKQRAGAHPQPHTVRPPQQAAASQESAVSQQSQQSAASQQSAVSQQSTASQQSAASHIRPAAPIPLVALEGGAAAGADGQQVPGKKKRRGRRGGRGRNKNRGLAVAGENAVSPDGNAGHEQVENEPASPAVVVARQEREERAAEPVTWRYADEAETAARPYEERPQEAASVKEPDSPDAAAAGRQPRGRGRSGPPRAKQPTPSNQDAPKRPARAPAKVEAPPPVKGKKPPPDAVPPAAKKPRARAVKRS